MAEQGKKKDKMKAARCLLDVTDIPPSAFALPDDGRQASHLQQQRKALAQVLAKAANADGSSIRISQETMAKKTGFSRAKVNRLLDDLKLLGVLTDEGYFRVAEKRYVSIRALHLSALLVSSSSQLVSSSPEGLSQVHTQLVSSSNQLVSSSLSTVREHETQPPLTAHTPPTHTEEKRVSISSFEAAAKWLQTDMLCSQWKRGEK